MAPPNDSAQLSRELDPPMGPDPELEALPKPRRPGRMLTLAAMTLTIAAAGFMMFALRSEARFALSSEPPLEIGELSSYVPRPEHENRWVHGQAELADTGAVKFGRPLEKGSYRLARVAKNERLWVQMRIPDGFEGPHFVAPNSFVGRIVPIADAGLRYRGLAEQSGMTNDDWLLIDGEAPATTRWVLGLLALFAAFAAFNAYGIARLLKPVKHA